jgi:predicted aspartyl protease
VSAEPGSSRHRRARLLVAVLIASAILVGASALVSLTSRADPAAEALAGSSVDSSTLPVTVPYREVAGSLVIDVRLAEGGPMVPMLLDTGAPTTLTRASVEAVDARPAGSIDVVSIDGQRVGSDVVVLPGIGIGQATFRGVGAAVRELSPGDPAACFTRAGSIGASLMRDAVWQLDPAARRLTIAASTDGLDHVDGATALAFMVDTPASPSPIIELDAGEGRLRLVLDSGTEGWLAVHPDDLAAAGIPISADAPVQHLRSIGAAGPFETELRWTAADLALPGAAGPTPVAAAAILEPGLGIAGLDLLSRFVVTIDWPARRLYLEPVARLAPTPPAAVSLGWDDGYVVGSFVQREGLPAGLQPGLPVTAIQGISTAGATRDAFCALVTGDDKPAAVSVEGVDDPVAVRPLPGFFSGITSHDRR